MQITVGSTITVEHPSPELVLWCEKNLIISNPEYAKKLRMHFWLGNTPKDLCLYETNGDSIILPYGTLRDILPMISSAKAFRAFTGRTRVNYECSVPLYDYQQTAVEVLREQRYGILQSPAGSGKTQMGIALMAELGLKTLWLTHTLDLLNQSRRRAELYMSSDLIGTITEGKVNIGSGVTFATVQTMCRLDLERYRDIWDVVIVDECFKGDTEVLTDKGFVRFDALSKSEKIAQYNDDGSIEFVTPLSYIKRHHEGTLVKFTVKSGRDVYMTENHVQPLFITETEYIKREPIKDISFYHGKSLIVSGKGTGCNEPLTHMERLAIASQADGTIQKICKDHVSWSVSFVKERKISRFLDLVSKAGIKFSEIKPSSPGSRRFYYETPRTVTKLLTDTFTLNMGVDRARDFIAEICQWDGSEQSGYDYYYSSTVKENSEFVSAVAVLAGYQSSLVVQHDNRSDKFANVYRVYGNSGFYKSSQNCKKRYVPYNGDVYCVEVPSHMIVVRADGFAFVSGNCHRCSGTPTAMTQFYKVLNNLAARHKYGLSATVHRSDGTIKATYALLGQVVYTVPEEAVADRVMKVGIKECHTGTKLSRECLNTDGTLNYAKLITYLCENSIRNHYISAEIVANAEHPSLILSDRLKHLELLMATLPRSMRKQAVMINGKMTSKKGKAEREQAIEDMRQGKKKYLFATYSLCKEGLDIPCLERLYMTTPQKDYAVVTQSIGRIARVSEGKQDPICYDFIDDAGYLVKAFKKRCATYRKNGCYFVEEVQNADSR